MHPRLFSREEVKTKAVVTKDGGTHDSVPGSGCRHQSSFGLAPTAVCILDLLLLYVQR